MPRFSFRTPVPSGGHSFPTIHIALPHRVRLGDYGCLVEYTAERISFRSKTHLITLLGDHLTIRVMTRAEVLITGAIGAVETREVTP